MLVTLDPRLLKAIMHQEFLIHDNPSEEDIMRAIDIAFKDRQAKYIIKRPNPDKNLQYYMCNHCQEITSVPTLTCECCTCLMTNYPDIKEQHIKYEYSKPTAVD